MIRNLTPHPIRVLREQDDSVLLEIPSEGVARVAVDAEPAGHAVQGKVRKVLVPLHEVRYGAPEGLPEPAPGVLLVVSAVVRAACPDRRDLVSPHDLVRDEAGRVIGCRGLARL
jgi:hypothetical protein